MKKIIIVNTQCIRLTKSFHCNPFYHEIGMSNSNQKGNIITWILGTISKVQLKHNEGDIDIEARYHIFLNFVEVQRLLICIPLIMGL